MIFLGNLTEWFKVLAWKASVLKGTTGSNPVVSALFCFAVCPQAVAAATPTESFCRTVPCRLPFGVAVATARAA